jgi:hypothetical protein
MKTEKRKGRGKCAGLPSDAWKEIQNLYMTTGLSNEEIGQRYGIGESAIRNRAKKEAWGPRNAAVQKRILVRNAAAGAAIGAGSAPATPEEKSVQDAANRDIETMEKAARVQIAILDRCELLMEMRSDADDPSSAPAILDPKDLKGVADASRAAAETYRKVRGLDEPEGGRDEPEQVAATAASLLDKLEKFRPREGA